MLTVRVRLVSHIGRTVLELVTDSDIKLRMLLEAIMPSVECVAKAEQAKNYNHKLDGMELFGLAEASLV